MILIAWRQSLLERQIDYGAKLGHVILSLARMELANFYQNVTPVTDFFDQRGMLIAVSMASKTYFLGTETGITVVCILFRGPFPKGLPGRPLIQ